MTTAFEEIELFNEQIKEMAKQYTSAQRFLNGLRVKGFVIHKEDEQIVLESYWNKTTQ